MHSDKIKETAVLFLHHEDSEIAQHNLNLLKTYNPTCDIIPVGFSWHNTIKNSHVVHRSDELPNNNILNKILFDGKSTSSESDLCVYDCFLYNQSYKHYFIIEWDTYCNCSLEEYCGEHIKTLDTFSALTFTNIPDLPDAQRKMNVKEWSWYYYFEMLKTPQEKEILLPFLGGTYPTSMLYYTHRALYDMVDLVLQNPRLYDNIQNEMRLGTLLQQSGYKLTEFGSDKNQFFEQETYRENIKNKVKGYYHPIKDIL